jgi:CRISPR-associated protein Csb2
MVRVQLRFPLGVYHALADNARGGPTPEWAPSPVRLVGALLAAAHEIPSDDLDLDRAIIQRLCEAGPPTVHAPLAVAAGEQPWRSPASPATPGETTVEHFAILRGASRWAPRNPSLAEMKGVSPRVVGRSRTEVDKGGVVTGDRPVAFAWPDLALDNEGMSRLRRLASDVAWIGTSRSPVIVTVDDRADLEETDPAALIWTPLPWDTVLADTQMRVPSADQLARFDRSFAERRARRDRAEPSGQLRPTVSRELWPYSVGHRRDPAARNPDHWGRMAFLVLDDESEMTPRVPSTYLVARALRAALMASFEERDAPGDAPGLLHGHDGTPHMAVVPLPNVNHPNADGTVKGFALVFPHGNRLPGVAEESRALESALRGFFPGADDRRRVKVPGAGSLLIRPATASDRSLALSPTRYTAPSRAWATVTPVVHSRWAKGRDAEALAKQVAADCFHVGLPEPEQIELLREPAVLAGAQRLTPPIRDLREEWRSSLQGPHSHLRLTFGEEIAGPLLLGRARHFGVGLMLPAASEIE